MRTAPKTKGTRNAAAKAMKSNSCHRSEIPKSQEHTSTNTYYIHIPREQTKTDAKTESQKERESAIIAAKRSPADRLQQTDNGATFS